MLLLIHDCLIYGYLLTCFTLLYADKNDLSHIISSHRFHLKILYITIVITITIIICYTLNFAITGEKTFIINTVTSIPVF